MNRRSFFKSMVGGIAATAAVRAWPFRVFSFPSEIKVARSLPMDLGFDCWRYAGIPIIEDVLVPPGRIFLIKNIPEYRANPNGDVIQTLKSFQRKHSHA